MSIERISSLEQFEQCLAESAARPVLLLKHSTTWPVSAGARSEFLGFSKQGTGARCVEVLVREDRPLSLAVAERTGVLHQSPQVILFSGGRACWHASHRDVTAAALREACPGGAAGQQEGGT